MAEILLVDAAKAQAPALEGIIRHFGYNLSILREQEAPSVLHDSLQPMPDTVVLDGADMNTKRQRIGQLRRAWPDIPIVALCDAAQAKELIAAGADDFVERPAIPERLMVSLRAAVAGKELRGELLRLQRDPIEMMLVFDESNPNPAIRNLYRLAEHAAMCDDPLLIQGESGTGKHALAYSIYRKHAHAGEPFTILDCREPQAQLAERLERIAEQGKPVTHARQTVLLKHIHALSLALQSSLVELICAQPLAARWIASSSENLAQQVAQGKFLPELHALFSRFPLYIPALRHRREDIPFLAQHWIKRHALNERSPAQTLSEDAQAWLLKAAWPGNIRQLMQVLWRVVLLAQDRLIDVVHLEQAVKLPATAKPGKSSRAEGSPPPSGAAYLPLLDAEGAVRRLDAMEAEIIQFALNHHKGHMSEVAKRLGIGRSTLYRKLQDIHPSGNAQSAGHGAS